MEYQDVKMSMGRAITHGDVFSRFYQIFLASHPTIGPMFKTTNMEQQKALLRQGVNLAIMFAEGRSIGKSAMDRLRASHSKKALAIDPSLYRYWLDSFMKALAEVDPEFNPGLEKKWRDTLSKAIRHIADGYDKKDETASG